MSEKRVGAALAAAVLVLALLVRAKIAEDWDGLGFVSSVTTFDLAAFSPHPPGYPVYVALLRIVALPLQDPALAGAVLSALAASICAYCTFVVLARRVGLFVAVVSSGSAAVASLPLRAASQVGTESLALAFLLGALTLPLTLPITIKEPTTTLAEGSKAPQAAARRAAMVAGLLSGLGLGVRLSWWPLFLAALLLAAKHTRMRALFFAGVGVLMWGVPLAWVVGPQKLLLLLSAHGEGHAQRFGKTLLHDGNVGGHLGAFTRDLTADGLGVDGTPWGLLLGLVCAAAFARFVMLWANGRVHPAAPVLLGLAAYALFVVLFQNVADSPRHVIPLVYAGVAASGVGASYLLPARALRARFAVGGALLLVLLVRGIADGRARTTEPPLGAQLVSFARAQPGASQGAVAVFGGDTARFALSAGLPGGYAENMGDVDLALGAMQTLPTTVLVTSEIAMGGRRAESERAVTLCRRSRLDRKHPCIGVHVLSPH